MTGKVTDEMLANWAADSRRIYGERNPKLAVQRAFRKFNIPIINEPGSRYIAVLKILASRGGKKTARMRQAGMIPARRVTSSTNTKEMWPTSLFHEQLMAPSGH